MISHSFFIWRFETAGYTDGGEPEKSAPQIIKPIPIGLLACVLVELRLLFHEPAYSEYYAPLYAFFAAIISLVLGMLGN